MLEVTSGPGRARSRTGAARTARGLTLVELMIGIAIGLVIAAAAISFLATSLHEQRRLLLESRLMQDLRTAADIVARDLRRAGYWGAAADSVRQFDTGSAPANPYLAIAPSSAASDSVAFLYSRDANENGVVDANERFGFRLRAGILEMQLGAGNWQALTDPGTLSVGTFSIEPSVQDVTLEQGCQSACPSASIDCPPRVSVRSLAVLLTGNAVADPSLSRTVRSLIRLRNDAVTGACPA
ncbi:MAG: prepilin-type N-terminal cleavage/methylation domain-containing protein [Caldimonas sp.]